MSDCQDANVVVASGPGVHVPVLSGRWARRSPALMLFLLAPMVGELLSSSSPPAEFFSPIGFVAMTVLYGGGALLCRELAHRWGKGLASLLLLGAAYGVVEEGLLVKSFFNPNFVDMGALGSYGRWGGVNWVWSVNLMIYHAMISIATPVVLTNLVFASRREDSWVSVRWMRILGGLVLLDVLVGLAFMGDGPGGPSYRPPVVPYCLAILLVGVLVWMAKRLPSAFFARGAGTAPREKVRRLLSSRLFALGFLMVAGYFIVPDVARQHGAYPLLTVALTTAYIGGIAWIVMRISDYGTTWLPRHQWALASGLLAPFILLAPVFEYGVIPRQDNVHGMTCVGLGFLVFLAWVRARVAREGRRGDRAQVAG